MPLGCGRIDRHEPHEWDSPRTGITYRCSGDVTTEGGHWAEWDAIDDAREDELDRQIREGLAEWGRSA